ncbi:unnamed protein product [Clonostachys solani]|uniref:Uncharacterized protein n=1 Tax=Clonostachys solani TaxID=160281 RepID=A0A9N9W0K2_9HYPO|nr:unnamed protein product [Clonostachys solani]
MDVVDVHVVFDQATVLLLLSRCVQWTSPVPVEKVVVVIVHVVVRVEDFTIEPASEPLHADLVVQLDHEDGEGAEKVTPAVTLSAFVKIEPLPVNDGEDCPGEMLVGGTAIVRNVVSDPRLLSEALEVSWAWVGWPVGNPKVVMDEPSDEARLELVQTPDKELKGPPIEDPERDKRAVNVVRSIPGVIDELDILRIDARFVSVAPGTVLGVVPSLVAGSFIVIVEVSKAVRVLTIVRETGPPDDEDSTGLDRVIKIGELKAGDEVVSVLAEDSIGLDRVMKIGELKAGDEAASALVEDPMGLDRVMKTGELKAEDEVVSALVEDPMGLDRVMKVGEVKAGGELVSSLAEGLESEDPLVGMGDPKLLDQLPGSETVIVRPEVAGDVSSLLGLLEVPEPRPRVVRQGIVDNVMRLGSGTPVTIWLSVLRDVKI